MNSITCMLTTAAIFAVFTYAVFAEPDDASQTEEVAQANAPLAMETSSLSKSFDDAGTMPFRCRTALKDFEKAIADANSAAVAQRAKVAEITRTYLKNALDKAQAAGDLGKVIAFRKALETADGEIAGDAEEIVKLRNGRAAQLEKIDKNLVASGIAAADAFRGTLEWQKRDTTQKGDIEKAQTIAAFVKQVDAWINETKDMMPSASKASPQTVRRPSAQPQHRKFVKIISTPEAKFKMPIGRMISIKANSAYGTEIGSFHQGDMLIIQYAKGNWTNHNGNPVYSPDVRPERAFGGVVVYHEENRIIMKKLCDLYIDRASCQKGVSAIPTDTEHFPFAYEVEKTGKYYLRINDNSVLDDNSGTVIYKVTSIPSVQVGAFKTSEEAGKCQWK